MTKVGGAQVSSHGYNGNISYSNSIKCNHTNTASNANGSYTPSAQDKFWQEIVAFEPYDHTSSRR